MEKIPLKFVLISVVAVLALLLHWLFIFNLRLAEEEEEAISGIPASCQREDTPPAVKADQWRQNYYLWPLVSAGVLSLTTVLMMILVIIDRQHCCRKEDKPLLSAYDENHKSNQQPTSLNSTFSLRLEVMRKISDQWFEQQRKLYRQELKNLRTLGGQESAEHWSEDEQRLYFEEEESAFEAVVAKAEEQIKQLFDECGKDIEDQQDRYRYWSTNAWSAALVAHMEQQRLEFLHTDANNVLNLMRLTIWIRLRLVDITCTRFFSDNSLLERMEIGFAEHQKQIDAQQRLVEQHLKETETMVEQRLGRLENGIDAHQQKQNEYVLRMSSLLCAVPVAASSAGGGTTGGGPHHGGGYGSRSSLLLLAEAEADPGGRSSSDIDGGGGSSPSCCCSSSSWSILFQNTVDATTQQQICEDNNNDASSKKRD